MFLPHQGEFALEESGLSCGGLFACAAYGFSLPAREGNFVNEVFAGARAAGFPRDEEAGGDEAADGGGGVAEERGGFIDGDAFGGGEHGE